MEPTFPSELVFALYVGLPLLMLVLAYFTGRLVGRSWDASLASRERQLAGLLATNLTALPAGRVETLGACIGGCVSSIDHFRRFGGRIRMIFGGELRSWTIILSRCRREAMVRMLEEARRLGATHVLNVRLETSTLVPVEEQRRGVSPVEFVAYGTAVRVVPG